MSRKKPSRISLHGPGARGPTISAAALGGALGPLLEGRERAVRLAAETRSVTNYRVPQGPRSGIAAILGKWPGDETDDELEDDLRHIS